LKKYDDLIRALKKELVIRKKELIDQSVETIYFGGGTPSLLKIDDLKLLVDTIYENYMVIGNPEITLEANPDDLTNKRINAYVNAPVNRLSIGIQSFFDTDLKDMNRAHSSEEAKDCLKKVTQHFDNVTIDLIYGIPTMTSQKWKENLDIAFSYGIPHISSYALTVEPKTALNSFIEKGKYPTVDGELALEHFNILVEETEKQGYVQYEISNFGKPNYFSKHNTSYWQGKHYLGIGPSAHSYNGISRSWNVANNTKYVKQLEENKLPSTNETLSHEDRFNEYIMIGLRTIWGVSLQKVKDEFGDKYLYHLKKSAKKYIDQGMLIRSSDREKLDRNESLITTKKGRFLIDGIASDLFMI
jgi:oxygen-independent coproporphyrinogen-3 oxidase